MAASACFCSTAFETLSAQKCPRTSSKLLYRIQHSEVKFNDEETELAVSNYRLL